MKLRALAPAKINLCLFLGPARADGRHELVTLFQALSLADEVTLTVLEAGPDRVICPGVSGENLAARALAALRDGGWGGPPVQVEITKRIPVAAGMAGGSADAAATLRLAMAITPRGFAQRTPNRIAKQFRELDGLAASLGADVPSQLVPGLQIGTGVGDLVQPYGPLAPHAFVIVPSERALATSDVFREADRLALPRNTAELEARHRSLGQVRPGDRLPADLIVNDLEPAAISLCPPVGAALADLRDAGAEYALVCGSGPTAAGLWWGTDAESSAQAAVAALRGRYPRAVAATPATPDVALPNPM